MQQPQQEETSQQEVAPLMAILGQFGQMIQQLGPMISQVLTAGDGKVSDNASASANSDPNAVMRVRLSDTYNALLQLLPPTLCRAWLLPGVRCCVQVSQQHPRVLQNMGAAIIAVYRSVLEILALQGEFEAALQDQKAACEAAALDTVQNEVAQGFANVLINALAYAGGIPGAVDAVNLPVPAAATATQQSSSGPTPAAAPQQ
jgi:hypothetical protein